MVSALFWYVNAEVLDRFHIYTIDWDDSHSNDITQWKYYLNFEFDTVVYMYIDV